MKVIFSSHQYLNFTIQFQHVFSSDNDPLVAKMIRENFKPDKLFRNISARDQRKTPSCDLYIAGFPCQPFSIAGLKQGFADEKGRGTVFYDIVNYITEKRPMVFILENVKGLVTLQNGSYGKRILQTLRDIKRAPPQNKQKKSF